jgi:hypothetical protein
MPQPQPPEKRLALIAEDNFLLATVYEGSWKGEDLCAA